VSPFQGSFFTSCHYPGIRSGRKLPSLLPGLSIFGPSVFFFLPTPIQVSVPVASSLHSCLGYPFSDLRSFFISPPQSRHSFRSQAPFTPAWAIHFRTSGLFLFPHPNPGIRSGRKLPSLLPGLSIFRPSVFFYFPIPIQVSVLVAIRGQREKPKVRVINGFIKN